MSTDTPRASGTAPWPAGVDRLILDETDSTNAEAARRAASSARRPTWIMARRQTAARGRRGRAWAAPDGNLSATCLLFPDEPPHIAALRSFVAANALFDALAQFVDPARLALKWPNDLLFDGGKAAGILLESAGQRGGLDWLAIGIGVNLASAPPRDAAATVAPVALGLDLAPEDMLTALAVAFAAEEAQFRAQGFAPIREKWLARAARLGEVVTARTARETLTGRFEDLDPSGELLLSTPLGPRRIAAADVFF